MRTVVSQHRTPVEIDRNVLNSSSCRLVSLAVLPDARYVKPEISGTRPSLGQLVVRQTERTSGYGRRDATAVSRVEIFRIDVLELMDMRMGYGSSNETASYMTYAGPAPTELINKVFELSGSADQGTFAARLLEFVEFAQRRVTTAFTTNLVINEELEIFVEGGPPVTITLQLSDS